MFTNIPVQVAERGLYMCPLPTIFDACVPRPENVNTKAVFSRVPRALYQRVWESIGEQKKLWLLQFDQQIYDLVRIYKEIVAAKQDKNTREIYLEEEIRSLLLKEFCKLGDKKAFYRSFEKALAMDIFFKENYFSLASNKKESLLLLAPVYKLINF